MTKPKDEGLQPIAQLLEGVLTEHGVREQMERMRALTLWPEVVGEIVAAATHARAVDEGALIVEVTSSAWLMELNMMKGDLLAKVNEHLGESRLNKIVFVLAETA